MKIKLSLALSVSLLSAVVPAMHASADPRLNRAVDRYLELVPMDTLVRDALVETSKQLPERDRRQFVENGMSGVRVEVLEDAARKSMRATFSADEVEALVRFMEQPAGRSVMGKMKYYLADMLPVVKAELARGASIVR